MPTVRNTRSRRGAVVARKRKLHMQLAAMRISAARPHATSAHRRARITLVRSLLDKPAGEHVVYGRYESTWLSCAQSTHSTRDIDAP
eukprot:791016-Prymnesium_polylepis.2